MKKLLNTIVKTLSIGLCVTTVTIPQVMQEINPQNLLNQKLNFSPNNLFDDRWTLQQPYPTDVHLIATEADNNFIISAGYSWNLDFIYSDLIISMDKGENWTLQRFETDSVISSLDKQGNSIWLGGFEFSSNNGFILKSSDLGKSWEEKLSIDSFAVTYINFFDENNGVVVSENDNSSSKKIYHTTDASSRF